MKLGAVSWCLDNSEICFLDITLQLVESSASCRKHASKSTCVAGKTLLNLLMNVWGDRREREAGVEDFLSSLKLAVESFF